MVAELKILLSFEEDLSDLEELRALIKKIKAVVWKLREKEVDDEQPRSESPKTDEYSEVNAVGGFGGKNTGKPDPWDGDTEQEFKTWWETKFGGKSSRRCRSRREAGVEAGRSRTTVGRRTTRCTVRSAYSVNKGRITGRDPNCRAWHEFESYRKAFAQGKKKIAENVHKARNRVSRPEIAESLEHMEARYKQWKQDIAYLKDIDAYDFGEAGMISILLDSLPDEARNMKRQATSPAL